MKLLLTGRHGQVAKALAARAALRPGYEIMSLARPEFDLSDARAGLESLGAVDADIVVNAAAYTAVDQAEAEPDAAMAANGVGAGEIAAWAAARGLPIIQISTDYVFDGTKAEAYNEADPVGPIGAYGRSKLEGERRVAASHPDHAILRTAWVFGPSGRNFVRTMLRLAESRSEVSVVADQMGCPSYAPDIADAILKVAQNLLAQPRASGATGVFHLAGLGETSWAGFAEAIFALSAERGGPSAIVRPITTAQYPTPARRPANSRLDCSLLARRHGVAMPHWRDALGRCLDHLIVNGKVVSP
jgi:dTDP-4-dehydrorhamnose reductase